jgi:hypothetical protein
MPRGCSFSLREKVRMRGNEVDYFKSGYPFD